MSTGGVARAVAPAYALASGLVAFLAGQRWSRAGFALVGVSAIGYFGGCLPAPDRGA